MMEFPYVNRRNQYYPIIPVTLRHGDREIRFEHFLVSFNERNRKLILKP